jgi:molybdenum cofactor cytidylyltransferase
VNVYAIVPAAGRSRRMGTQKLLLSFAGTTVIGQIVRTLRASPVRGVIVVTSPAEPAVASAAREAGAEVVANNDPAAEMLGSVRRGIRALPADCDAALVALGDQPTLRPELVTALVESAAGGSIVVPLFRGRRGHPVLVPSRLFGEVLTRFDGVGLRGLLATHGEDVVELPAGDEWVLHDVDDPDAYRAAVALNSDPPPPPPFPGRGQG